MTTVPAQLPEATPEKRRLARFLVRETWASLAIAVIWLVVLFSALEGPDIVSSSAGSFTRIPSAVIVAFFAYLATRVVAKYGLGARETDDGYSER
jgi:hypothetical protein